MTRLTTTFHHLSTFSCMSKIDYLNLDIGEPVTSTRDEFNEKTLSDMTAWLSGALKNKGFIPLPPPFSGYNALISRGEDGLVCSVYGLEKIMPSEAVMKAGGEVPEEGLPLLIFGVAPEKGESLWNLFIQGFYVGEQVIRMPAEPWVTMIPYQMFRYAPDPDLLVTFQKCIAHSLLDLDKQSR